jgi:hypothetical protein
MFYLGLSNLTFQEDETNEELERIGDNLYFSL